MSKQPSKIYIIGAGYAGVTIAKEILDKKKSSRIVAFIDDDVAKIGTSILEIPVLGPINTIGNYLKTSATDEALIAMPSATTARLRIIYKQLEIIGFKRIRIVPAVSQILDNGIHLALTRDVNPNDLLTRSYNPINIADTLNFFQGKRVLITGAGGTIGAELSTLLLHGGVQRLYLLGHGEFSIYGIYNKLQLLQEENVGVRTDIIPIIGEIQDHDFIDYIFKKLRADIVIHSAAYKHVPLGEQNPISFVINNVFGTLNVASSAKKHAVKTFISISSDKAVEPISLYGATKLIAEHITLTHNGIVARYGNVLGSRGSIIPLFQRQIEEGGPVTVTTPTVQRYFMTLSEAAALVLKSCSIGKGGQLYALNMGESYLIKDIAEQLIKLYGYTPNRDIAIEYIGARDGDKEMEKLYSDTEQCFEEISKGIHQIDYPSIITDRLWQLLDDLRPICFRAAHKLSVYRNTDEARKLLKRYTPTLYSTA